MENRKRHLHNISNYTSPSVNISNFIALYAMYALNYYSQIDEDASKVSNCLFKHSVHQKDSVIFFGPVLLNKLGILKNNIMSHVFYIKLKINIQLTYYGHTLQIHTIYMFSKQVRICFIIFFLSLSYKDGGHCSRGRRQVLLLSD